MIIIMKTDMFFLLQFVSEIRKVNNILSESLEISSAF